MYMPLMEEKLCAYIKGLTGQAIHDYLLFIIFDVPQKAKPSGATNVIMIQWPF